MTGLLILDRHRLQSVNLRKLSANLVTGRAITAAEKVTIGLATGQLPVIMASGGRGWSLSKGYLGNLGYDLSPADRQFGGRRLEDTHSEA